MSDDCDRNGRLPPRQRVVVQRHEVAAGDIVMIAATESVAAPVDWCFEESHHTIVVHLDGRLDRMESVFELGPSSAALPSIGDVWVIPAGHRYAALAQGNQVGFTEFHLPVELLGAGGVTARVGHRDPFLHHAAAQAMSLAARTDDLAPMALQALLDALRFHFADAYMSGGAARPVAGPSPHRFSRRQMALLDEHITDCLHEPLSIADLAGLVGYSKTRLLEVFKASFGTTPWQYILRVRVAAARRLLDRTNMSITRVAIATGFSSPSHFSSAFCTHVGMTPTRYRRATRPGDRWP